MRLRKIAAASTAALLALWTVLEPLPVLAQTQQPPQVQTVNPTDLFQDVVNGIPQAGNQYASALTLAGYNGSLPARANALVGGDATTNLFQRATTGASETTTVTYGGPDRWAYWSGTSTAMTVSQDSTAADLPAAYKYGFKMARTSSQTGVVQVCMAQEIESVNSYQFQGSTAELDFHATAGSNFSAASSNMQAYIVTGTGTDEGMSKLAYTVNAGGGGASAWTGAATLTAALIPITTTPGRYAVVSNIPTTATEIGVALCFTPVGTASTNDYIAFAGIQLVRNSSLASDASATAGTSLGYNCPGNSGQSSAIQCTSFDRSRPQGLESLLQYRYFYSIAEGAATLPRAMCVNHTVTETSCLVSFPAIMRTTPTASLTAGFSAITTTAGGTLGACSSLALDTGLGGNANKGSPITPLTALVLCGATTIPAAGGSNVLMDDAGSGLMQFNAEL